MVHWDAIILTCHTEFKSVYEQELQQLQDLGLLPKSNICLVQCLKDPVRDVGSGGATINAILQTVEYLSASEGLTVLDCNVLKEKRIIIFLDGRPSLFDSMGMTFSSLSQSSSETISMEPSNFYHLYCEITKNMTSNCPYGVWIISMDMMLSIEEEFPNDWSSLSSEHAIAFSFLVDENFAKENGIYCVDKDYVEDILYKDTDYCATNSPPFRSVCGLLYFSHNMSERLLALHLMPSFEGCTYLGIDNGAKPVKLSLFFDLLASMAPKSSHAKCAQAKFLQDISKSRSNSFRQTSFVSSGDQEIYNLEYRSRVLREHFSNFKIRNVLLKGFLSYPGTSGTEYQNCLRRMRTLPDIQSKENHQNFLRINSMVPQELRITNSTLIDCNITSQMRSLRIENCHLFGIDSKLAPVIFSSPDQDFVLNDTCICCFPIVSANSQVNPYALFLFSLSDFSQGVYHHLMNIPLFDYMKQREMSDIDLWNDTLDSTKSALNAKLFPVFDENYCSSDLNKVVFWLLGHKPFITDYNKSILTIWRELPRMSLEEILLHVDIERAFAARRNLLYERMEEEISDVLTRGLNRPINHLFNIAIVNKQVDRLLNLLDSLYTKVEHSLVLLARLLSSIADLLGSSAQNKGGLRSGPAANSHWLPAFRLLDQSQYKDGVELMQTLRVGWLKEANSLIRCSRHYEMASQIIIRRSVWTAVNFITSLSIPTVSNKLPRSVRVDCPARIDLAGGWSDTPPICYERGGHVINMSVTVNGCKPISCSVERTNEHDKVVIQSDDDDRDLFVVTSIDDLYNYDKPYIEGALVKAVIAFVGWDIKTKVKNLSEFNSALFKCSGLIVSVWCKLPKGSGLGTSSILAGGLLAALWRLQDKTVDTLEIIHAVLVIEQMMTTGGGWQDQVGGLCPGVSSGYSAPALPLRVDVEALDVADCLSEINNRFLLVYTGMTRLARNLLKLLGTGLPELLELWK